MNKLPSIFLDWHLTILLQFSAEGKGLHLCQRALFRSLDESLGAFACTHTLRQRAVSRSDGRNADPSHSGPTDAPTKQAGGQPSKGMAVSKSESHITTTRSRMLCLPRVKHGSDRDDFPKKKPPKKRDSSLPPLGGGKKAL